MVNACVSLSRRFNILRSAALSSRGYLGNTRWASCTSRKASSFTPRTSWLKTTPASRTRFLRTSDRFTCHTRRSDCLHLHLTWRIGLIVARSDCLHRHLTWRIGLVGWLEGLTFRTVQTFWRVKHVEFVWDHFCSGERVNKVYQLNGPGGPR